MENNILLGAVKNAALTVPGEELGGAFSQERLALAGRMTLLGMVMIFAVLAALWGILAIFQKVMASNVKKPAKATDKTPTPVPAATAPVQVSNDDEVIAAVIAAAIAAYTADEGIAQTANNSGFRVVSFRRVQGGKAWNSKH